MGSPRAFETRLNSRVACLRIGVSVAAR